MLKRFISEDPIGLMAGVNFYGYVYQNPLGYTDPTGEIALPIKIIIGATVAGAVSQGVATAIMGGSAADVRSAIVGGAILGAGIGIGAASRTPSGMVIGTIIGIAGDAISAADVLGDELKPTSECP